MVSEAKFRLGYSQYLLGDYDKAGETLKQILAPPAPPEIQELGASLLPQVFAGKAGKLKPGDPQPPDFPFLAKPISVPDLVAGVERHLPARSVQRARSA